MPRRIFTFGDFDHLHVGQIRLLNFAKSLGEELTVALRTDEAMDGFHKERWFSFDERLEVLSSLRMIDFIRVLDENSPISMLIDMYRVGEGPQIIVDGFYRLGKFAGTRDLEVAVGAYGGMVIPFNTTSDRAIFWALKTLKDKSRMMKRLRRKV